MALAALASALALMASGPSHMLLAQAGAPGAESPQSTAPTSPALPAEKMPAGAPADDYGFMGWCYGALSGHIDLYEKVLPEVKRIETTFPAPGESIDKVMAGYADQHNRGKMLLTRYGKALEAEEARNQTGGANRKDAIEKGREIWTGSDTADSRTLAQLWMSWGLPGRCDSLARRLTAAKAKH